MSVYLGNYGQIELRRSSDATQKNSVVNPADVNVSRRRFSFDFDAGFLTTGDQIEIRSTNGANLDFVDPSGWVVNARQTAGTWYVNVDELGGIRLFDTFDKALSGVQSQAVVLTTPSQDIPISVRIVNAIPHLLAQCTYFELSTNREVADITALGDEFRSQYSGLVSGSGTLRAYWDYMPTYVRSTAAESANYLLQLAIRTEVGARFGARLYLKAPGVGNRASTLDDEIWYEIDGVVTQAGVNFSTDNAVEINIDYVTTGAIRLLSRTTPTNKVLQENSDDIRLEQNIQQSLLQEDAA